MKVVYWRWEGAKERLMVGCFRLCFCQPCASPAWVQKRPRAFPACTGTNLTPTDFLYLFIHDRGDTELNAVASDPQQKGQRWHALSVAAARHSSCNEPSTWPRNTANSLHRLSPSSRSPAAVLTWCKLALGPPGTLRVCLVPHAWSHSRSRLESAKHFPLYFALKNICDLVNYLGRSLSPQWSALLS